MACFKAVFYQLTLSHHGTRGLINQLFENVNIKQEIKRKLEQTINQMRDVRMQEFWRKETSHRRIKYGLDERIMIGQMKLTANIKNFLATLYDTSLLIFSNRAYLNYEGKYTITE